MGEMGWGAKSSASYGNMVATRGDRPPPEKVARVNLRDFFRILRKSWIVVVALTLVGGGVALGYSLWQKPVYSAATKVFVSTSTVSTVQDLAQGNTFTVQRVKTYADLATTPIVLDPVIRQLSLNTTSELLSKDIKSSAPLDTSIIDISVSNTNPAAAARIANATARSLTSTVQDIETSNKLDSSSPVKLTLVQTAVVPTVPDSPKIPLNTALGLLIGLALGIGIALLADSLNVRVRSSRDVTELTELPILGGILLDPEADTRPLVVQAEPKSIRSEAYRALRTNLQFLSSGHPVANTAFASSVSSGATFGGLSASTNPARATSHRGIVFTSAIASEGKSTTVANLGIALAEAGLRVLVVDADLRRPRAAKVLGLVGAVGLSDVLIGRVEPTAALQQWGSKSLYVLPAGQVPPNPSELLGSAAMVALIDWLGVNFDVVLYDAPALLPVTDAAILAKIVDETIVVVGINRTTKSQLTATLVALENASVTPAGIVLTLLPTKGPDAYEYGYYNYYYASDADSPDASPATARAAKKAAKRARKETAERVNREIRLQKKSRRNTVELTTTGSFAAVSQDPPADRPHS
jgi:succinoglycan biosynthesis transport protein ExoP